MHHSILMKVSVPYTEQNVTKSQNNRTLPSRQKKKKKYMFMDFLA